MSKFILAYHGGSMPESPQEAESVMARWMAWLESLGSAVIDGGDPVGPSTIIQPDGSSAPDNGSNPLSGYSLVEAENLTEAIRMARGCPHLASGGTINVAVAMDL